MARQPAVAKPMAPLPNNVGSLASRWRWLVLGVFVLSSSLNYLDRLLLAALAPTIKNEFHLSNAGYGSIISAFSLVYAVAAPLAGLLVDRVGLNAGVTIAMSVWSAAGAATGLTRGFGGLLTCRTVLGAGEAAGIPCTAKANGLYLGAEDLAFGTAMNQVGITIGSVAAPLMVAGLAPAYGWRFPFMLCGLLGFAWIPLWWFTSHSVPARVVSSDAGSPSVAAIIRDPRMWGLVAANALVMTLYTLWTNWTTVYLVQERHLSEIDANRQFAWIPPVFATLGGFCGGWLAFRAIRRGVAVQKARMRVCWISGVALLVTALVPLTPTPMFAAAAISVSFFWCLCISTNLYAMPIDWYGAGRAAFGVSMITCSFGLMTAAISPAIGLVVDRMGFAPVCEVMAVLPLAGITILHASSRKTTLRPPEFGKDSFR
jgi:MFS transporter, ACS family, hexuronate transporter